jgi:hypothetical protein
VGKADIFADHFEVLYQSHHGGVAHDNADIEREMELACRAPDGQYNSDFVQSELDRVLDASVDNSPGMDEVHIAFVKCFPEN